ncbi:MAG: SDR family NAD(P)-dependent oxidoreductase [Dehalococcoidia bacterium]
MQLKDAVAVVTGASRGIGRATALAFAREGASVVCTARSSDDAPTKLPGTIEETVRMVREAGGTALAVPCDISREEQVQALAERTLAEFGRVDVLVNNAAVNYMAPFAETPLKRWDLVLNVNLRGTIMCTQAFLPSMLESGGGSIVNVSSGAVTDIPITVELGIIPYAVSKVAVERLTTFLAEELRPEGIPVNCLRIEEAIATEGARLANPAADFWGWATPEACADAILWMATRGPAYTGRILTLAEVREAREGTA